MVPTTAMSDFFIQEGLAYKSFQNISITLVEKDRDPLFQHGARRTIDVANSESIILIPVAAVHSHWPTFYFPVETHIQKQPLNLVDYSTLNVFPKQFAAWVHVLSHSIILIFSRLFQASRHSYRYVYQSNGTSTGRMYVLRGAETTGSFMSSSSTI